MDNVLNLNGNTSGELYDQCIIIKQGNAFTHRITSCKVKESQEDSHAYKFLILLTMQGIVHLEINFSAKHYRQRYIWHKSIIMNCIIIIIIAMLQFYKYCKFLNNSPMPVQHMHLLLKSDYQICIFLNNIQDIVIDFMVHIRE